MLAYGFEVVLPVEVAFHTHWLTTFLEALNNAALREALDHLPSIRNDALIREALYKLRIARLHNRTVRIQPIQVSDLVLRCTNAIARAGEHDKLSTNWEGFYKVTSQICPGTYRLETLQGTPISRAWHSSNLRKYHIWAYVCSFYPSGMYPCNLPNKYLRPGGHFLHTCLPPAPV